MLRENRGKKPNHANTTRKAKLEYDFIIYQQHLEMKEDCMNFSNDNTNANTNFSLVDDTGSELKSLKLESKEVHLNENLGKKRKRDCNSSQKKQKSGLGYTAKPDVVATKAVNNNSPEKIKKMKHFPFRLGMRIKNYEIVRFLGDGTFGRVLEVRDSSGQEWAMKVIKPYSKFISDAKLEAKILRWAIDIQKQEKVEPRIVEVKELINFQKNRVKYCAIIFEKLGKSLYQIMEENDILGNHFN